VENKLQTIAKFIEIKLKAVSIASIALTHHDWETRWLQNG